MSLRGVFKENNQITRLRVVFDISVPTSPGVTLNDLQYVRPIIQDDLASIIFPFKQNVKVFCADIFIMFVKFGSIAVIELCKKFSEDQIQRQTKGILPKHLFFRPSVIT